MPDNVNFGAPDAPLSLTILLVNLAIGFGLAIILRIHFRAFGSTLSNREEFAQVFPFIVLTTVLIISVVKSSLALSLGLVGALSIVRFRTPIKEPEELAYLFVAIAFGLGLGANQTIPTVVAGLSILVATALLAKLRRGDIGKNIYLSLDLNDEDISGAFERINAIVLKHVQETDLRRYDTREGSMEAVYFLDITGVDSLAALTAQLRNEFPAIGVTFLDQNQLPSV